MDTTIIQNQLTTLKNCKSQINETLEEKLGHSVSGKPTDWSSYIDEIDEFPVGDIDINIEPKELEDLSYLPNLRGIEIGSNEQVVYQTYEVNNPEYDDFYVYNLLMNATGKYDVEFGYLNESDQFVSYGDQFKKLGTNNTTLGGMFQDLGLPNYDQLKYIVVKIRVTSGQINGTQNISITMPNGVVAPISAARVVDVRYSLPKAYGTSNHIRWLTDYYTLKRITCENLVSLTSLANAFANCYQLEDLKFVNCDFSKVASLSSTFLQCVSLQEIDLSGIPIEIPTTIGLIFGSCSSLKNIKTSPEIQNFSKVTSLNQAFQYCISLKQLPDMFSREMTVTGVANMLDCCYSLLGTIDLSKVKSTANVSLSTTFGNCNSVTKIIMPKIAGITTLAYGFVNDYKLKSIQGFDQISVKSVNSAYQTFLGCYSLHDFDVLDENIAMPFAYTLHQTFQDCYSLKHIPRALLNIDLTNMSTSTNYTFVSLFKSCRSLEGTLDLSNLVNMTTAKSFDSTFHECYKIEKIILPKNLPVTTLYSAFCRNYNLTEVVNLDSINTSSCTSFTSCFNGCHLINKIDISNFNITSATSFSNFCIHCYVLQDLNLPEIPKNHKITTITNFADYCFNLRKLVIKGEGRLSDATTNGYITRFCNNIRYLDLTSVLFDKITSTSYGLTVPYCTREMIIDLGSYSQSVNLSISNAYCISKNSLGDVINSLTQRTPTQRTLTLGAGQKAMLTDEQIADINNKNWKL